MTLFRLFLFILLVVIVVYTLFVGFEHGWNLIPPFFSEIQAMSWQGQFNLDFMMFLLLSALWCVWRNDFSPLGWGLSVFGATGGMLFLSIYLLILSIQTRGDVAAMILGERRARALDR